MLSIFTPIATAAKTFWGWRKYTLPALAIAVITALALLSHYRLIELRSAVCGREGAEQQLKATQRVAAAQIDALQQTAEETHDRDSFTAKTQHDLADLAKTEKGDGPLAPVSLLGLDRLRKRQAQHAAQLHH